MATLSPKDDDGLPPRAPQPAVSAPNAHGPEEDDNQDNRSNKPLIALLFLIVLAVGGWLLVTRMMDANKMQDCIMSGRKNCAPIDTGGP